MRLLVVSSWMPYPPDNGSRLRAYHLLTHLSRHHPITLLTFGDPRGPEDLVPLQDLCERVEVLPPRQAPPDGLGMKGLLTKVPRHFAQTRSPAMVDMVTSALPGHDAVLALQPAAAFHVPRLLALPPAILDEIEVGVFREQYLREPSAVRRLRHGLTWWKHQGFVRSLTERFDRSTVVSELEREHLRDIGCDVSRIAVVPNGVEIPERPVVTSRARRLVYPGSVQYSANLDAVRFFVQDVFPLVRRSQPDLQFVVTGATDGVEIAGLAGVEGVTFTGRLPDVDPLIAESAACVVPLRIGGGTRLKILHAMALGTPVVSTSKGIEGLAAQPDRHLLVGDSAAAFASQILRVVDDADLGARLASAGLDLVKGQYAWGPIAHTLDDVLREAVADRKRQSSGNR